MKIHPREAQGLTRMYFHSKIIVAQNLAFVRSCLARKSMMTLRVIMRLQLAFGQLSIAVRRTALSMVRRTMRIRALRALIIQRIAVRRTALKSMMTLTGRRPVKVIMRLQLANQAFGLMASLVSRSEGPLYPKVRPFGPGLLGSPGLRPGSKQKTK